jgi:hypothetical protein
LHVLLALNLLGALALLLGLAAVIAVNRRIQLVGVTGLAAIWVRFMVSIFVFVAVSAPIIFGLSALARPD